jgi:hypothetical protein
LLLLLMLTCLMMSEFEWEVFGLTTGNLLLQLLTQLIARIISTGTLRSSKFRGCMMI